MASKREQTRRTVERIQTGVRMERRLLLVLKGLAGSLGLTLGDKLDLGAADSHLLVERSAAPARPRRTGRTGSNGRAGRAPR